MERWSNKCLKHCLRSAICNDAKIDSPKKEVDVSAILHVYHDLAHVFSKRKALSLPPHCPYDGSIDLLPGAPLHASRLYNLSGPERESMKTYIEESLNSGIVYPSTFTVGAGFFFVMKDKTLYPCTVLITEA